MRTPPFSTRLLVDLLHHRRGRLVGRPHGVLGIAERERRVEHRDVLVEAVERGEIVMRHLHRADAHAVDHLAQIAELRAGEDADLDAPLRLLADQLGELGGVAGLRLAFGAHMGVAPDGLLLGEGGRRGQHQGRQQRRRRARSSDIVFSPIGGSFLPQICASASRQGIPWRASVFVRTAKSRPAPDPAKSLFTSGLNAICNLSENDPGCNESITHGTKRRAS